MRTSTDDEVTTQTAMSASVGSNRGAFGEEENG
jgi:hypothetical protein